MFGFFHPTPPPPPYYRPSAGDVFGSVLAFFLIFFVLMIALAELLFPVFVVFLCIGIAMGIFYALVVYIRAFVDACKLLGNVRGRNGLTRFLLRWLNLFARASWSAFKDNFNIAKNALIRAGGYRFLSFKKWMWLLVAPSVLVFGTALILAIAFAQLFIFFNLAIFLIGLVLAILALLFLGAFVYGIIGTIRNFAYTAGSHGNIFTTFDFSKYPMWKELFPVHVKSYFATLFGYCKEICKENWSQGVANFQSAKTYSAFSFWRYFLLISPVALNVVSVLFVILFMVFFLLEFVLMLLSNVVWIIIAKIFFH